VQSDAKEGEDLHGEAAIRLNVASRVDHVDHLYLYAMHMEVVGHVGYVDLHGQAVICQTCL